MVGVLTEVLEQSVVHVGVPEFVLDDGKKAPTVF